MGGAAAGDPLRADGEAGPHRRRGSYRQAPGASIEIVAYVLTDWEVIDALNAAAVRGVQVRVILDPRERSTVDRMVGLDVRRKLPGPLMHLKAYAVDDAVLRTGSANFSHSGEIFRTTT